MRITTELREKILAVWPERRGNPDAVLDICVEEVKEHLLHLGSGSELVALTRENDRIRCGARIGFLLGRAADLDDFLHGLVELPYNGYVNNW